MAHGRKKDVLMRAPTRSMWQRALVLFAAFCLGYSGVVAQLFRVQLLQGNDWRARAQEQQLSEQVTAARRGGIYDCNGEALARSVETATVLMRPAAIADEAARVQIADEVSRLLGVDREKLYRNAGKTFSRCETVATRVDYEKSDAFLDWLREHPQPGVFRVVRDYKREYPGGRLLSCVMGFTGADGSGLEGLEARYDEALAGEAGRVLLTQNGWGDALPDDLQYEDAVNGQAGNDLTLTVDANIQRIAEQYLETAVRQTGATNRGCVIVMEVDTGAVLAMATKQDYDLNDPRTPNGYAQGLLTEWAADDPGDKTLEALQRQWKNKAISEYYEPGSVFKTFTASMGLELGLVSETTPFYCSGYYSMPGAPMMKCHVYPRSHGSQTFAEAISHSCNPAFMTLGGMIGGAAFSRYFEAFGFTARTGIDMLGEARVSAALYHAPDQITPLDVATSSIGQTFKVTPIQMITAMSAVANGGELVTPYVVQRVTAPDGTVLFEHTRTVQRRVISAQTSARLCAMLEGVVDGGGAKNAYVAGGHVGGKTGTSVKTDGAVQADGRKNVVASFMGIAPADDPKVAVLVLLDEPQTQIRYGGTLAAPVAQKIFSAILPYLGVEARYTEQEQKERARTVPDATGCTVTAAQQRLEQVGLRVHIVGDGETVLRQSPAPGDVIGPGGRVVLYTADGPAEQTAVPELVGRTLAQANQMAAEAGLNLLIEGWTQDAGQAYIGEQSAAGGTQLPIGSAIQVRLLYRDAIE